LLKRAIYINQHGIPTDGLDTIGHMERDAA
jgi:hypothetical protein